MFIKTSVAHYCIEWLCMALCDLVWPCTAFFTLNGVLWSYMVLYGLLWSFMVKYRFYWTYIIFSRGHRSKFIWSCLLYSSSKAAPEWKPPFLSAEEFVHLMLEAIDGFVLIINICDNGRIMYASEGITWLLGHLPNSLIERNVSIYDITAEEDIDVLRETLTEKNALGNGNQEKMDLDDMAGGNGGLVKSPTLDVYVHVEKGGAHKELDFNKSHALVKLSGYLARWPQHQNNSQQQNSDVAKVPCDENCLPRK